MNHTIAVVAHTARLEQAHHLANHVNANYISVDDGTLGCELNHRKCWLWHLENTTTEWCINLEDDAVPVENFPQQTHQALSAAPAPIVSLYLGRHHIPTLDWEQRKQHAIAQADNNNAHWLTTNTLLHAVAVAIKRNVLHHIITHTMRLPDFLPNDEAITHYAMNNRATIAYTWPSLADHADQPTLFKHHDKLPRPPGRVAYRTGTHQTWTDKAVTM